MNDNLTDAQMKVLLENTIKDAETAIEYYSAIEPGLHRIASEREKVMKAAEVAMKKSQDFLVVAQTSYGKGKKECDALFKAACSYLSTYLNCVGEYQSAFDNANNVSINLDALREKYAHLIKWRHDPRTALYTINNHAQSNMIDNLLDVIGSKKKATGEN
jgi:hypothetical protein